MQTASKVIKEDINMLIWNVIVIHMCEGPADWLVNANNSW